MLKHKIVETTSGARYIVYPEGRIHRAGTAAIVGASQQFEEGTLTYNEDYFHLILGSHLYWYASNPHSIEHIKSSPITSIIEKED